MGHLAVNHDNVLLIQRRVMGTKGWNKWKLYSTQIWSDPRLAERARAYIAHSVHPVRSEFRVKKYVPEGDEE